MTRWRLSAREREVLVLVANGYTNARIGRELDIHPTTVQGHLSNIFRALGGAEDRTHACTIAIKLGEIGVHQIQLPGEQAKEA